MAKLHMMKVRALPIRVIAAKWAEETGEDYLPIETELRRSVLNIERVRQNLPLLEHVPLEPSLPPATIELDREHIKWFCAKQGNWPLPEFWFGKKIPERRKPGRPSLNKNAIVQEFKRLRLEHQLPNTKSAQARAV